MKTYKTLALAPNRLYTVADSSTFRIVHVAFRHPMAQHQAIAGTSIMLYAKKESFAVCNLVRDRCESFSNVVHIVDSEDVKLYLIGDECVSVLYEE